MREWTKRWAYSSSFPKQAHCTSGPQFGDWSWRKLRWVSFTPLPAIECSLPPFWISGSHQRPSKIGCKLSETTEEARAREIILQSKSYLLIDSEWRNISERKGGVTEPLWHLSPESG